MLPVCSPLTRAERPKSGAFPVTLPAPTGDEPATAPQPGTRSPATGSRSPGRPARTSQPSSPRCCEPCRPPPVGRAGVACCGPWTHLFDSTLGANLRRAVPDAADDDELVDALERAQLGAWFAALPDGLDTRVGEQGRLQHVADIINSAAATWRPGREPASEE
jgi:hypothetical protein